METTNKIIFWPLNRVVNFVFFFLLWNYLVNLKFIKKNFWKEIFSSFRKQFVFIFINKIIAWKLNNNKETFSRGNLCCWVRDGKENFSENLVDFLNILLQF